MHDRGTDSGKGAVAAAALGLILSLLMASCAPPQNLPSTATRTGVAYRVARQRLDAAMQRWESRHEITGLQERGGFHRRSYRFTPTGPGGHAELADWGLTPLYATLRSAARGTDATLAAGSWGSRYSLVPHPDPAAEIWKEKLMQALAAPPPTPGVKRPGRT